MSRIMLAILIGIALVLAIGLSARVESRAADVPRLTIDCGSLTGSGLIEIETSTGIYRHQIECGARRGVAI
jgi:hypothetical protein